MIDLQVKTKSELIEEYLLEHILPQYAAGEKIPSELDLSKQLNTSRPTVHKVLANLVTKGRLYRVNGVGTFVSSPAATSRTVSVILTSAQQLDPHSHPSWFNSQYMLEGLAEVTRSAGYKLDLIYLDPDAQSLEQGVEILLQEEAAGYIFLGLGGYVSLIEALQERGKICVCRTTGPSSYNSVHGLMSDGVYDAVEELLRSDRQRIAYMALDENSTYCLCRYEGYARALEAHKRLPDPGLARYGEGFPEDGYRLMKDLLALPEPPDAVFAGTDMRAFGVMKAIREAGLRIPEDIAVVGSDNLPEAQRQDPPLASVDYPLFKMGQVMFGILQEAVKKPALQPINRALPCRFVKRASC
jgi:DNA-binding LacI/PurR family transcriptional regulator